VCGAAFLRGETIIVDDVERFADHIVCDSASRSEIVVPFFRGNDVAGVFDDVAESFQLGFESGDANRRRPHVNAATLLAKVERNADYLDGAAENASERCGNAFHG
jgi:putative methionine-R-sulfoxide reductase with GAF domain